MNSIIQIYFYDDASTCTAIFPSELNETISKYPVTDKL
jgi:hypothetical protein